MNKIFNRAQNKIGKADEEALLPPVQVFKNFIENEPNVYGEFIRMFENVDTTEVSLKISIFAIILWINA